MNTRTKDTLSAELVYIGGIGFMFELNQSLKHNLISPDVLAFFDSVLKSEKVTKDCAFPLAKPNTNLRHSIFQNVGFDWVVCSDGVFRKCQKVKCVIEHNSNSEPAIFHIDKTLVYDNIAGIVSL